MSFLMPENWTRRDGFPLISGSADSVSLTDEFYTLYDLTDVFSKLPVNGSLYDEESVSPQIASLRLTSYEIKPTDSKKHAFITLVYQPSDAQVSPEDGVEEYFLENQTLEQPLEKHADYKTMWNYDLWEFVEVNGGASALPAWSTTATDKSDASGEARENSYSWNKEKPSGGYKDGDQIYDWIKVQDRTKAGVESFIIPSPVIQERKHYRSKLSANTAGNSVGSLETPEQTFGITGGEWLVMSATVQRDGSKYLVERSFQYADDWDGDLYT